MKKILILFAVILFGVTASFGQAYTLNISWSEQNCDCQGTDEDNYFKIDYKIIDVANDDYEVISLTTETTPNANYTNWPISVPAVSTYCGSIHDNTPSFKVYVWVWLMETYLGPPTECCAGRSENSPYTCQNFNDGIINIPQITLN